MNTIIFVYLKNIFHLSFRLIFAFRIAMEIESQRIYNLNCVPQEERQSRDKKDLEFGDNLICVMSKLFRFVSISSG